MLISKLSQKRRLSCVRYECLRDVTNIICFTFSFFYHFDRIMVFLEKSIDDENYKEIDESIQT